MVCAKPRGFRGGHRLASHDLEESIVYNRFMLARILAETGASKVGSIEVAQSADGLPPAVESGRVPSLACIDLPQRLEWASEIPAQPCAVATRQARPAS